MSEEKAAAVLKTGVQSKKEFTKFAGSLLTFAQQIRNLTSASPAFEQVWGSPACASLKSLYNRFEQLGRCFTHLFCANIPEIYQGDIIGDADVLFFYQYAGDEVMEKSIRRLFSDSSLWFNGEVLELIQKGAGAALNSDKIGDLQHLLASDAEARTPALLKQATELVKAIRSSTRSQKMSEILGKFVEAWTQSVGLLCSLLTLRLRLMQI